jgi:hypothetical protein
MTKRVKSVKPATTRKTTVKTTALIPQRPQRHGGALNAGGTEGNAGGPGRPPSVLRERLRGSFDKRIEVLEAIADGDVMQRAEIPLWRILEHAKCPKCNGKLEATDAAALFLTTVEASVSAGPRDRISAIKLMGDLGLGPDKQLSMESVQEKLRAQLDLLRMTLEPPLFAEIVPKLRAVWVTK